VLAPIVTAWIATRFSWRAAILVTSASALIGVVSWFLVRPDRSLVVEADIVPLPEPATV
jgi:ACS family glucarate transporter-like MFS transporter